MRMFLCFLLFFFGCVLNVRGGIYYKRFYSYEGRGMIVRFGFGFVYVRKLVEIEGFGGY